MTARTFKGGRDEFFAKPRQRRRHRFWKCFERIRGSWDEKSKDSKVFTSQDEGKGRTQNQKEIRSQGNSKGIFLEKRKTMQANF